MVLPALNATLEGPFRVSVAAASYCVTYVPPAVTSTTRMLFWSAMNACPLGPMVTPFGCPIVTGHELCEHKIATTTGAWAGQARRRRW